MGNIGFILIQGILGAFAGYITNTYAVNMLFKEYTPLKLGGVVKKNKEKFVDEISSLVEDDIINGNTLKDKIESREFKEAILKVSNDFFNECLPEKINNKKIKEIPGYYETRTHIENYINSNFKNIFSDLCNNALENFTLEDVLKKEYINELSQNLYNIILKEAENNKELQDIIYDIYNENTSLCLNDVLSENSKEFLKDSLEDMTRNCISSIINNPEKLKNLLEKIYNCLNIDEAIDKLQISLKDKSFSEIFTEEDIKILSHNLYDYINKYLNSNNGSELISNILNKVLDILRNIDSTLYNILPSKSKKETSLNDEDIEMLDETAFTLYDIIPEKFEDSIFDFINKSLNEFLPYVAEWVKVNEENFNDLIEESIDEGIGDLDEGLRKKIIELVRKNLLSDVASSSDIIGKMLNYIDDDETKEEVSKELTEKIIAFLKDTKIKDLINKIESLNILNDNTITKITNSLRNSFSKNGEGLINKILLKLSSKKVGLFLKIDLKELFDRSGKNKIYEYILKNKKSLNEKAEKISLEFINTKYNEILNLKLREIIKSEKAKKLSKAAKVLGRRYLKKNKSIPKLLNEKIQEKLYSLDLKETYENNKETLNNFLTKILTKEVKVKLNKYENNEINDLVLKISKKETSDFICEKGHKYLSENAENLLKGKIKKVIYDNLIIQDEDEICNIAQRFMGNQLKPISIFGGALGLLVGIIFGFFTANASLSLPIKTISSCIIMASIGVLTNVIAIAMLFKPYTRNKLLAKIPLLKHFSLGYIPAHKDNLSEGIGNVIDKELLNGGKLKEFFKNKHDIGVNTLSSYIKADNYKLILDFITKKSNSIANSLYNFVKNILTKRKRVFKYLSNTKVGKYLKKSYFNKAIEKVKEIDYSTLLSKKLEKIKDDKKNINNIVSKENLEILENKIDEKIFSILNENYSKFFKEEFIKNIIFKNEALYEKAIDKSLSSILNKTTIETVKNKAEEYTKNFIYSDLRVYAKNKVTNFLSKEIDEDKTIGTAFNGAIKITLDKNLYKLGDFVALQLIKLVKNKKEDIKTLVSNKVSENLNFLEKMAYNFMGGDEILSNCVDVLIDKKIEGFINDRVFEIAGVLNAGLNNVIYPKEIRVLQLKASEINTDKVIDNIFDMLYSTDSLKEDIDNIINVSLNKITNIKLKTVLYNVNLDSLDKVYNKFNKDIIIVLNELSKNFNKNINEASLYLNSIAKEYYIIPIKNLSLDNIKYEDIKYSTDFILNKVLNSNSFNIHVEKISNKLYDNIESHKISYFIGNESIKNMIDFIFENEHFNLINIEILDKNIQNISNNINEIVDDKTKDYLTFIVCDGLLSSVINNMQNLIYSVHLKEITKTQIDKMDPREIHELFKSFAGEFFNKLYLYGSFGFVFGINIYLSILLTIAYFINDYQVNKK